MPWLHGHLCDWEMAMSLTLHLLPRRQSGCTGTWHFVVTSITTGPLKKGPGHVTRSLSWWWHLGGSETQYDWGPWHGTWAKCTYSPVDAP